MRPDEPPDAPLRVLAWPAFASRSRNPHQFLLYGALRERGVEVVEFSPRALVTRRADVWHIHWPDLLLQDPRAARAFLRGVALLSAMSWARRRGIAIVWTVHNLRAHEGLHPALERRFWRRFARRVDAFISLSAAAVPAIRGAFHLSGATPVHVVPRGDYRGAYPAAGGREAARRRIGEPPETTMVLFLGRIRAYKNVEALIAAFRAVADPSASLHVAGLPHTAALRDAVTAEAAGDPRVRLRLRFASDTELAELFAAATLVVLPYREILNSGTALLALSFGRPVLVPEKGAMAELRERAGGGWVRTYPGELTGAEMEAAIAWARDPARPPAPPAGAFSWDAAADRTKAIYADLRRHRNARRTAR